MHLRDGLAVAGQLIIGFFTVTAIGLFGMPLWAAYIVCALVVIPIVTYGIRFISGLQLWTQPIWLVLQIAPLAYIALSDQRAIDDWTSFAGRHGDVAAVGLARRPLRPAAAGPPPQDPASAVPPPAERRTAMRVLGDYISLTKPRVLMLLLVAAVTSMLIAAGPHVGVWTIVAVLLGGAMASGAGSSFNQWYERDIDGMMGRTAKRPVAAGRISGPHVLAFSLSLAVGSFMVLAVFVNLLAAFLALGGALFYVAVYTLWLKRYSPQNIVIGGVAGAFPVLVGWAAVTGQVTLPALILSARPISRLLRPSSSFCLRISFTLRMESLRVAISPPSGADGVHFPAPLRGPLPTAARDLSLALAACPERFEGDHDARNARSPLRNR